MSETPTPRSLNARPWRRFAPIALLSVLLAAALFSGAGEALSWTALAERQEELRSLIATRPWLSAALFVALYALAAAISLPGALWFTIASGVLFGWAWGAVYAWAGAVSGATLAFLAARSAFAGVFRARAGGRLARFKAGFERDAFSYLLTLRIVPAPFFLVNVAPAFFDVRLGTFVAATAIGIVPATVLYAALGAGAGEALSRGRPPDLSLLADPRLWLVGAGLAGLALSPLAVKAWRRSRARVFPDEGRRD